MVKNWPSYLGRYFRVHTRSIFVAIAIVVGSLGLAAIPVQDTFAAPPEVYGNNSASCQIATIGWVVCPVMRSVATLADFGFAFINQNFLRIEYGISNTNSGVFKAWELMRNIANALFVLAFMAIIYAQITGKSAGGYSIKRMLPRLVIGAILVNISYYVCVIGIEASNIVGTSVLALMQGVADPIGPSAMPLNNAETGFDNYRLSDITSAILGKPGYVWILLAPVAAVTISIALVCAVALVLLIMRKVVIAMLLLVSPLMFVAYLLPNTEKYFQQWLRLFFQLLLLFPVIAFLLGAGQIVSATIMNVGSDDSNYRVMNDDYLPKAGTGGSGSATTDLAAAGAAVLPLLGTWFLLKSLSSVVTNAGSKVAGNIGRGRSKTEEDKLKAKMNGTAKQSVAGSGLPTYDRKPAFSRLRRRRGAATLADLPSKTSGNKTSSSGSSSAGKAGSVPTASSSSNMPSVLDRAAGNTNSTNGLPINPTSEDAPITDEVTATGASAAAAATQANLQASLTAANDKKDSKTAKDIFNNLNKSQDMNGKKPLGGNSGGNASTGQGQPGSTTSQPMAPSNNFASTPSAASPMIQASSSAPQIQQIIAAPTAAVDASAFINRDRAGAANVTAINPAMPQPPSSDVEKKATARAQKYIFDSQDNPGQSSDRIDELKEQAKKLEETKQDNKDER